MIAVVDYGAGNLKSVVNAFESIHAKVRVTSNPGDLKEASAIVVPGVGAFGDGMQQLRRLGFVEALQYHVLEKKKPYLGICLGLQFLAQEGYELGRYEGLGWVSGRVERLNPEDPGCRIPHMGWNAVDVDLSCPLFEGLERSPDFYFVHSFHLVPDSSAKARITGSSWHGTRVTAALQQGHIFGVQFHPEKSQQNGLIVLENFVKHVKAGPC